MAKKIINLINVERDELDNFCDGLPEPIIAKPIFKAVRGRGLTLSLKYPETLVTVVDCGEPCFFPSIDMIVFELDGLPNVDPSRLMQKTSYCQYV